MVGEEEADGMGMVDEAEEVRTGTGVEGDIMGNMVVWICMIPRRPAHMGSDSGICILLGLKAM